MSNLYDVFREKFIEFIVNMRELVDKKGGDEKIDLMLITLKVLFTTETDTNKIIDIIEKHIITTTNTLDESNLDKNINQRLQIFEDIIKRRNVNVIIDLIKSMTKDHIEILKNITPYLDQFKIFWNTRISDNGKQRIWVDYIDDIFEVIKDILSSK